jgi:GNAT superfamily N-acetyltransferase
MPKTHALMLSVWTEFARRLNGEFVETPVIAYPCSRTSAAFFNIAFLSQPAVSREELFSQARSLQEIPLAREFPNFLCVAHDHIVDGVNADETLAGDGWFPAFALTEMEANSVRFSDSPSPLTHIARANTQETRTILNDLNCHAYHMPVEALRGIVDTESFLPPETHAYVGFADSTPVSCAVTLEHEDCLYLALVATAPDQQRKGYGRAIVELSLREAMKESGRGRILLHATVAGAPVYERLGFTAGARFTLFGKA